MESHADQIARVVLMATGADTWDLSKHDIYALKTVLAERAELLDALKKLMRIAPAVSSVEDGVVAYAKRAIAKAEAGK